MSEALQLQFESDLDRFAKLLELYARASGKTMAQVVYQKGRQLSIALQREMRKIAPPSGSIREERIAALRAGEGLRIRASAKKFADSHTIATATNIDTRLGMAFMEKNKRGNLKAGGRSWQQVAVARELAMRESGRGFLAQAAKFKFVDGEVDIKRYASESLSRYNKALGQFIYSDEGQSSSVLMHWGGISDASNNIVEAMMRAKGQQAFINAISNVMSDMLPYIERKLSEQGERIFK